MNKSPCLIHMESLLQFKTWNLATTDMATIAQFQYLPINQTVTVTAPHLR